MADETLRPPSDDTLRPAADETANRPGEQRVLVVDDEPSMGQSLARMLAKAGFATTVAVDGNDALREIMTARFDVIVSDIHMPGTSGVELLRVVRAYDLDVPVILMTGGPDVETAIQAVELGALQSLCKPFDGEKLVGVVARAARLHEMARLKREGLKLLGFEAATAADRAGLGAGLDRALAALHFVLQPIVSLRGRRTIAHEVLMRSPEPTLPSPGAVLDAAERTDRLRELGRRVRGLASDVLATLPGDSLLFVNLHPRDLLDPELADAASPLAPHAHRVVLEITERASLEDVPDAQARVSILRFLGYRFALDDLGAGHAGLGGFAKCEPEFVKLDMSLVRDIHRSPARQRLVRGLCSLAHELGSVVIAEGIESAAERDVLADFGCDLMQGYFFAKPAPKPPVVAWS
ncbi:MAG TPA: EAL domain-containing protein [Minicystis sp.]|nr:EAL domain-containing protein [Minicystis sp.]